MIEKQIVTSWEVDHEIFETPVRSRGSGGGVVTDDRDSMTAKAARRLIRTTRKPIYAWVTMHADDGAYLQVQKGSVLVSIHADSDAQYFVKEREDGVYIN